MSFWVLLLTGIGLSMDAFAVAICRGLKMKKLNYQHTALIALFFGGFQALMPFIGWLLGCQFSENIKKIDHWIAFVLLAFIGGKMIYEAFDKEEENTKETLDVKELLVLAVATSIDAFAVGFTFAFLNVKIGFAVAVIGVTTFVLSAIGVAVGHFFGVMYKQKAEIAGGVILILIGTKILLEHLNIISF